MRDLFFLASLVVGMCTWVFTLAIWLADNEKVNRRFAGLTFSGIRRKRI